MPRKWIKWLSIRYKGKRGETKVCLGKQVENISHELVPFGFDWGSEAHLFLASLTGWRSWCLDEGNFILVFGWYSWTGPHLDKNWQYAAFIMQMIWLDFIPRYGKRQLVSPFLNVARGSRLLLPQLRGQADDHLGRQQMQDSASESRQALSCFPVKATATLPPAGRCYPLHRCRWNILEPHYQTGSFGINILSGTEWELSHLGKYEISGERFLSFVLLNKVFQLKDE